MNPIPYNGQIHYNGITASFGLARESDAEQLAQLYREIAVTRENYRTKLNPASPNSFAAEGGMFQIHSAGSIRRAMDSSFFAVLRIGGRITSSFWVSFTDPDFAAYSPDFSTFEGSAACYSSLCGALAQGGAAYLRELIVLPGMRAIPGAARLMYYTVCRALCQAGYTHSLGVVYRVVEYRDAQGAHAVCLCNCRSCRVITSAAAIRLGTLQSKTLTLDGFSVQVEPVAFCFDSSRVLPKLYCAFQLQGVQIRFCEGGAL